MWAATTCCIKLVGSAVVFAFGFPKRLEGDDVALVSMALTMILKSFYGGCDFAGLYVGMLAFASESDQNGSS